MKKLYSTIMMLAMMVAALSFTACGGSNSDDEFDGGGSSSSPGSNKATISYAGKDYKISSPYMEMYVYEENTNGKKYFYFWLGNTLQMFIYVNQKPTVGSDLNSYSPKISISDMYKSMGYYDLSSIAYKSGTAKVINVDNNSITVSFEKYTYSFKTESNTQPNAQEKNHDLIFDGKVCFATD